MADKQLCLVGTTDLSDAIAPDEAARDALRLMSDFSFFKGLHNWRGLCLHAPAHLFQETDAGSSGLWVLFEDGHSFTEFLLVSLQVKRQCC